MISVLSNSVLYKCIQEPLLILKKCIVLLHTLLANNSLLLCQKVYLADPRECLCAQAEGMVKPVKTLVLIQHHFKRIL